MKRLNENPLFTVILIATLLVALCLLYLSHYEPKEFIYMQF